MCGDRRFRIGPAGGRIGGIDKTGSLLHLIAEFCVSARSRVGWSIPVGLECAVIAASVREV